MASARWALLVVVVVAWLIMVPGAVGAPGPTHTLGVALAAMPETAMGHKVCVVNVPWKADANAVREALACFGEITHAILAPKQEDVSEHRGFGFVVFCEESSLDNLLGGDFSRFVKLENGPRVEVSDTR